MDDSEYNDGDIIINNTDSSDETISLYAKQFYYWESISLVPRDLNPVIVKVFVGGKLSNQLSPFLSAVSTVEKTIANQKRARMDMQIIFSDDVKNSLNFNEKSFTNYFLESHIHLIITHMHQGMHKYPNGNFSVLMWNIPNLLNEIKRLYFHCGFPNGRSLSCPVWTQDKFSYLQPLQNTRFVNKTLKIEVIDFSELSELEVTEVYSLWRTALKRFAEETQDIYEGKGYFVKAPFTTNSEFARGSKTIEDVIRTLRCGCNRYSKPFITVPYLLVQVRMANNREIKIICLGTVPTYCLQTPRNSCPKGFAFQEPHENLFSFASEAIKTLKQVNKDFICDALVRVDIFQRRDKSLVVNEFESFEADFGTLDYNTGTGEREATGFLEKYWTKILFDCYNKATKNK